MARKETKAEVEFYRRQQRGAEAEGQRYSLHKGTKQTKLLHFILFIAFREIQGSGSAFLCSLL